MFALRKMDWGILLASLCVAADCRADRLLLRDLELIRNKTVKAFDEDGVRLDNERLISWDRIQQGTVASGKQDDFDRTLRELGEPLFRIRVRLRFGDFAGLRDYAESLYPRYAGRNSQTSYMVSLALMWSRIEAGRREEAVAPYLRCVAFLLNSAGQDHLPGHLRLEFDADTGLTPVLLPVWFDSDAAKSALPQVREAVQAIVHPRPEGVYLYYASLALAAGDSQVALDALKLVSGKQRSMVELRDVLLAQYEIVNDRSADAVASLHAELDTLLPQNRALALYWLGRDQVKGNDGRLRRQGVLLLLRLPALLGDTYPELAAAGLHLAMQTLEELNETEAAEALRRELLLGYAHTVYGAKVKSSPK